MLQFYLINKLSALCISLSNGFNNIEVDNCCVENISAESVNLTNECYGGKMEGLLCLLGC